MRRRAIVAVVGEAGDAAAVLRALADGLDSEIERWEARSREDAEARSVLRAFLAVREVLWELGTRFDPAEEARECRCQPGRVFWQRESGSSKGSSSDEPLLHA